VEPTYQAWFRLVPTAVFEDPWTEAARVLMPIDVVGWPAIGRGWDPVNDGRWVAPNLDLSVSFRASRRAASSVGMAACGPTMAASSRPACSSC
jgi:hypothetical protein